MLLCSSNKSDNLINCLQTLLNRRSVDVSYQDCSDWNSLIALCYRNNDHPDFISILRLLIERGIDLSCTDDQNRNALLIICELYNGPGLLEIVRLLVESHIDVHLRDKGGLSVIEILENRQDFHADCEIMQFLKEAMKNKQLRTTVQCF